MGFAHCRRPPCCWFLDVSSLVILSLLKCVLARWFLDVSFHVTFWRRILLFWRPRPIIWQARCLHFGTLGDHFGTLGHRGGPWEQQEGHVGVWNLIFVDFSMILGPHFKSYFGTEG